jgi:hypothetical protein
LLPETPWNKGFMRIRTGLTICLVASIGAHGITVHAQNPTTLTGAVKNDASLQSSVHLTPQNGRPANVWQGGMSGAGLSGGAGANGGSPGIGGLQQFNGSHMTGATTPTTTYTFTPRTSVMQIPGGMVSTPPTTFHGVQNYDGLGGTMQHFDSTTTPGTSPDMGGTYSTTRGVTTAGGYSVRPVYGSGQGAGNPEWEFSFLSSIGRTTSMNHGVTYAAGLEPLHSADAQKLTYSGPATSTTVFGARDGVVSYVPGYEVRVSSVGVQKQTIGGMWSVPEVKVPTALGGDVHPLLAKAQLLPSLLPKADKVTNWELWYSRVSAAIYGKWKYADVGPGTAKVRVTISADKQVSAQIVDFTAAGDVQRDASTETTFRETALRAVRLLTPDEIPAFPAGADMAKVTVDVDLQRDATTNAGFDVAKAEAKVSGELLKPR